MTGQELINWIALKWVPGLGNVGFVTLVEAFGSPKEVFSAPIAKLKAAPGIGPQVAAQIKAFSKWPEVEMELSVALKHRVSIITYRDLDYPNNLLNIYDFPPLIYVKGTLREEDVCVAVVGSRMASTYGRFSTERLCRELALKGITIVSGLARGIDTAAHQGSLAARGRTIAVLGCGMDIIYPPENKELFEKISLQGAIITEFPYGTPPQGPNFPARNRIISGLSLGVVVVEANYRSGSLITARVALEQGREVFAVPGSIDAEGSKGTNKLIKEGAKLIEGAEDILEEILPQIRKKLVPPPPKKVNQPNPDKRDKRVKDIIFCQKNAKNNILLTKSSADDPAVKQPSAPSQEALTEGEVKLLKHLSADPVSVDHIIAVTGGKAGEILNTLLLLELKGIISQLPGKKFIRKEQ